MIEIIVEKIWQLKAAGISMIVIGHTKRKSNVDVATGEEYDMLTANMSPRYFNAIKSKRHVLGVASIDRTIEKKRVKQKIGDDKTVGKVVGESRIITFRDDNFNIDSKSRFDEIVPQIDLDADQLITAIKDAIEKAHEKQRVKKPIKQVEVEQLKEKKLVVDEHLSKLNDEKVDVDRNKELILEFKELYNAASDDEKEIVTSYITANNISLKLFEETPTNHFEKLVNLLKLNN